MRYKFFDPTHLKHKKIKVTLGRYLRYHIRKVIFYSYMKKFENFINTHQFFIDFFEQYLLSAYVVIKSFCNKKFNAKQRVEHIFSDLTFMEKLCVDKNICLWREAIEIWSLSDNEDIFYRLFLEKNPETSEEGFWAIVLRDKNGTRIYHASFTITPDNNLLIASIQGSREGNAIEEMKNLTKKLFGLRPPSFLIEVLKILTKVFDCNQTLGIFPSLQIRSTKGVKKGFYADYHKIWTESYGKAIKISNHWYYNLAHKQKSLEEISSNKRSMYKKRFEMFKQLEELLNAKLANRLSK